MFSSESGDFDIKKEHINRKDIPVVSSGVAGRGLIGSTDIKAKVFAYINIHVLMCTCVLTHDNKNAMILLSATAALRIIELQRVNVGNIETIAGEKVLFIQGKGRNEADEYKKLTPEVFECISEYLDTRTHKGSDAPLFASVGNRSMEQRLTEPSIAAVIKDRFVSAGYDSHKLSAHSLHHSSITYLLKSGQASRKHSTTPDTQAPKPRVYMPIISNRNRNTSNSVYMIIFSGLNRMN